MAIGLGQGPMTQFPVGQQLVGGGPVNPFDPTVNMPLPSQSNQATEQDTPEARRRGWKAFVERFKSDPNLQASLMQFAIGLSQPAATPSAGIGQALNAGMTMMQGLDNQRFERQRAERADQRDERRVGVAERGADLEAGRLEETRAAREDRMDISTQELDLRRRNLERQWEETRNNQQYQQEALRLRSQEAGGQQGAVNQRWNRLTENLLQTSPDLYGDDPERARSNAELHAWQLMNGANSRGQLKARLMADRVAFLPDPGRNPEEYAQEFERLDSQIEQILNASGVTDDTVFRPVTGAEAPRRFRRGEQFSAPDGSTAAVVSADPTHVTIQTPAGPMRLTHKELADQIANGSLTEATNVQ